MLHHMYQCKNLYDKLTLNKMALHSVMSGPVEMTAELKLHFQGLN